MSIVARGLGLPRRGSVVAWGLGAATAEQAQQPAASSAVHIVIAGRLPWDLRRKRRDEALLLGRRWEL